MCLGGRSVRIERAYRVFKDNELYVGAARLGALFNSRIVVDWAELSVTFLEADKLPLGMRVRRETAREAFLQRTRGLQPERAFGLERPSWDGLVLDYSFLAAGEQPLGGGAYSAGLGADAFGGSLELGVQSVGPTGDGHARGAASWTGVWRDGRWVKQLRLGDGFTSGPRVRPERGGLSAGQCLTPTCRATGNLDFRYGVSERWTVRAGVEQFWRDGLPNRTHPYVTTVLSPSNAWAVSLEGVAGASAAAGVQFEPSLNLRWAAVYTAYAADTAPALAPPGLRSAWVLTGFVRPIPASGFFTFDGLVGGSRTATGVATIARLGAAVQAHDVRLAPYVRLQRDAAADGVPTTHPYVGFDAFALPRPALGPLFGAVWMRAHVEQQLDGGPQAVQVFAARPLSSGVRLEVGVGKFAGTPGATFTLSLSSYLPAVRTLTLVSAPTAGGPSASQFVQGSVLWNRSDGRLTYAPGPSLQRAGLTGRVFLDENGDGRWEAGEPVVPGVRVLVGTSSASSDSSGWFRVWDLVPFEPVLVTVDSLSIDSPLLVPAFGSASIEPGPNRFPTLDIPLVPAGVVEGRVRRVTPQGPEAVAGVTLVLTDRRSGARRSFATFSDGAFYVLGVKPGLYDLTVDPHVLAVLNATAQPLRVTVAPTPTGVGASDLDVLLTPKP